ncbi:MAG: glucose 1-dehydrogenase [Rhodobiaceae bacterium]|nr:glucose 1-dehydrogenase [Rhodobiaceae bacterium]MCC0012519.1 glucose 1-dehydrogenase [Rhodobiaceae bacterium]MCC0061726.1 glucose 1-dehydrogenase [Rhodobiaceae bacterium]
MGEGGRLSGKMALITGGAGGIGQAIACAFLKQGASVMLSDIDASHAGAAANRLSEVGEIHACQHDVTDEASWNQALEKTVSALGGLNVLVNNAGIWVAGSVEDVTPDAWRRGMSVNLDSVYLGTRQALPHLRESQPASIINISSIAGIIAGPNLAAYNAAKAGVWMLTKATALHAARGGNNIRCNSIHPYFIDTPLLQDVFARGGERKALNDDQRGKLASQAPLGRLCTTDDVANAALYLASDESGYMTGAEIKLDGGFSAQ